MQRGEGREREALSVPLPSLSPPDKKTQASVLSILPCFFFQYNFQGMFDCDGDRREFAHKQYVNFVGRMEGGADAAAEQPPAAPAPAATQGDAKQQ